MSDRKHFGKAGCSSLPKRSSLLSLGCEDRRVRVLNPTKSENGSNFKPRQTGCHYSPVRTLYRSRSYAPRCARTHAQTRHLMSETLPRKHTHTHARTHLHTAIPDDLGFRLAFLDIYSQVPGTEEGREAVLDRCVCVCVCTRSCARACVYTCA